MIAIAKPRIRFIVSPLMILRTTKCSTQRRTSLWESGLPRYFVTYKAVERSFLYGSHNSFGVRGLGEKIRDTCNDDCGHFCEPFALASGINRMPHALATPGPKPEATPDSLRPTLARSAQDS